MEYQKLVDVGAFEGESIELIDGQLIVAEPKGSPHAAAVGMAHDALRAALSPGWIVRIQDPLALDDESAPEPDLAVARDARRGRLGARPGAGAAVGEAAAALTAYSVSPG